MSEARPKFLFRLLHLWFWLSRGLTLGVRGAVFDEAGRVFLIRHTYVKGWHLPGGGVEVGETALDALARELREELGIEAVAGAAVACVEMDYPGKRLRLDVREAAFSGSPRGLEGQALAWVPLHRLRDYPMPPADAPLVAWLRDLV